MTVVKSSRGFTYELLLDNVPFSALPDRTMYEIDQETIERVNAGEEDAGPAPPNEAKGDPVRQQQQDESGGRGDRYTDESIKGADRSRDDGGYRDNDDDQCFHPSKKPVYKPGTFLGSDSAALDVGIG